MDFNNYDPSPHNGHPEVDLNAAVKHFTQVNQLTNNGNRAVSPLLPGVFASLASEVQDINRQYKVLGAEDGFGLTAQQAMMKAQQINQELMMRRRQERLQVNQKDLQELGELFEQANQTSNKRSKRVKQPVQTQYKQPPVSQYTQDYFEEDNGNYVQEELPMEYEEVEVKNNQHSGYAPGLTEEDKQFFTAQFKVLNDNLTKIFDLLKNQIEPKLEVSCKEIKTPKTVTSSTEKASRPPIFLQFDDTEDELEEIPAEDIEEQSNDGQTTQITYPD